MAIPVRYMPPFSCEQFPKDHAVLQAKAVVKAGGHIRRSAELLGHKWMQRDWLVVSSSLGNGGGQMHERRGAVKH
jgi:hypothetical protein